MRVLILLYLGDFERRFIFEGGRGSFLRVDELDEGDVLGELCDLVVLEVDDDVVLGA